MERNYKTPQETYDALHEKEFKETKYCFAKGLNEIEREKSGLSHRIKRIKRRFEIEADNNVRLAEIINNKELKKIKTEILEDCFEHHQKRIQRVCYLAHYPQYFSKNTLRENPDFNKFINFSVANQDAIELEIASRQINEN